MTTTTLTITTDHTATEVETTECPWCGKDVEVTEDTERLIYCEGRTHLHPDCSDAHDQECTFRDCFPEDDYRDRWDW